jgi:hypothetical protein
MKRIFLFIGVAGFYTAACQQKELFDINRHLQNKSTKKPLLKLYDKPAIDFKSKFNQFSLNYTLPNGDKVITSPEYKMPVITPGKSLIYNMPTLFIPFYKDLLQKLPYHIPNPANDRLVIVR